MAEEENKPKGPLDDSETKPESEVSEEIEEKKVEEEKKPDTEDFNHSGTLNETNAYFSLSFSPHEEENNFIG